MSRTARLVTDDGNYPTPTRTTLRARVERMLAPSFGWCLRCGRPWRFAKEHQTPYKPEHGDYGCFALCESCWAQLTPEERLPFYERLSDLWAATIPESILEERDIEGDRKLIREAVLSGR